MPRPSPDRTGSSDGRRFPHSIGIKIDEIPADGPEPFLHANERVSPAVANAAIIGDAATFRARLAEYVAAGVTHVVVDSPQDAATVRSSLQARANR